jgi:protocatechuate 3,4-dioxygenase beta subunit
MRDRAVNDREGAVTDEVIASFAATQDARTKEIVESLTRHLHGFAREVRLTQEEWDAGIGFLTRVGHITDDRRQEFILLSDALGLSMLTVGINSPPSTAATQSTVFGPFFVEGAPEVPLGGDIAFGATGNPCWVTGHVRAVDGSPIAGASLDVWEADADGFYDVQYDGDVTAGRGRLTADAEGGYRFWSVLPSAYGIPDDGSVGELLAATSRGNMRPAHLHFKVDAPGYRTLITHIFVAGDEHLGHDAVFGVKSSLIAEFPEHPPGTAPDGRVLDGPWNSVQFDIVLEPASAALLVDGHG